MKNLHETMHLPYKKKEGPLPIEVLSSERIIVTNCQRYTQMRFFHLGVPIPPELALSLEAFEGLGSPILIANAISEFSMQDFLFHGQNLDIVFAERRVKGKSMREPKSDVDTEWKKNLHMGIYAGGHVDHSHSLRGSAEIEPLNDFARRYHLIGLRRLDLKSETIHKYNKFVGEYFRQKDLVESSG
jgi:hypothetical protein